MMLFRLLPFGNGSAFLKPIDLRVDATAREVMILGRNSQTGTDAMGSCPKAVFVSRSHLQLCIKGEQIFVKPISREKNAIFMNGQVLDCSQETELHIGDTLLLIGKLDFFNFILKDVTPSPEIIEDDKANDESVSKRARVEVVELLDASPPPFNPSSGASKEDREIVSLLDESDEDISAISILNPIPRAVQEASSSSTIPPAAPQAQAAAAPAAGHDVSVLVNSLLQQYECGICFETMACAVSLSPCGDSFCFTCIASWAAKQHTHCPFCNGAFDIKHALPNRMVDHSAREVLKNDAEALTEWEKRVKAGQEARKAALAPAAVAVQQNVPQLHRFINQRAAGTGLQQPHQYQPEQRNRQRVFGGGIEVLPENEGRSSSSRNRRAPRFGVAQEYQLREAEDEYGARFAGIRAESEVYRWSDGYPTTLPSSFSDASNSHAVPMNSRNRELIMDLTADTDHTSSAARHTPAQGQRQEEPKRYDLYR